MNGASLDGFLKMGCCQTAPIWPILEFFGSGISKNFGPIPGQAAEIIGGLLSTELQSYRVTESQSDRVTDTQGYPVYGWGKYFCA